MKVTRNTIRKVVEDSKKRPSSDLTKHKKTISPRTSTVKKTHHIITPDKKRKSSNHDDTDESMGKESYLTSTPNLSDLDCSQQHSKQDYTSTDAPIGFKPVNNGKMNLPAI